MQLVERLEMKPFPEVYSEEGRQLYHPSLMLKVWLHAYLIELTSAAATGARGSVVSLPGRGRSRVSRVSGFPGVLCRHSDVDEVRHLELLVREHKAHHAFMK